MIYKLLFFGYLFSSSLAITIVGGYWYFEKNYKDALAWFILGICSIFLSLLSLIVCIIRLKPREPQLRLIDYYEDN